MSSVRFKDYILKDHFYFSQKDNKNSDGSDNMKWTKQWGRFNGCFISSASATFNQVVTRLRSIGKAIGNALIDETIYLQGFLNFVNTNGKVDYDNGERFYWDHQCKYLNSLTKESFPDQDLGTWKTCQFNQKKLLQLLEDGWQVVVGIRIKKYFPNGDGHVTSCIGYSEDEKERISGLFFNDPAGLITAGKSYYSDISGEEVFYDDEVCKNVLNEKSQMLYFEVKK